LASKNSTSRRAAGVVSFALLLIGCWFLWFRSPPQLGTDEEAFKSVDALFTAVTARDERLLGQCAQRLHALKDAGKLPRIAADYLDGVIGQAREGRWESAAERLYDFMQGQRREGAPSAHARSDKGPLGPRKK
jgi:hypothetical protein